MYKNIITILISCFIGLLLVYIGGIFYFYINLNKERPYHFKNLKTLKFHKIYTEKLHHLKWLNRITKENVIDEDFLFNRYMPIVLNENLSKSQRSLDLSNLVEEVFPDQSFTFPANLIATEVFETMMFKKLNITEFDEISDVMGFIRSNVADLRSESKMITVKKDTPLTSLTDSVRVLLQSVIADAKAKGIDEIVLPPIEKLAEKRFGTNPDGSPSKAYIKAITKGSGFHNTYVVAFDKALKQLQSELGNQIKIGKKDLKYKDIVVQGKSINIKDLKLDPKTSKLRFNKGGLVKGLMSR